MTKIKDADNRELWSGLVKVAKGTQWSVNKKKKKRNKLTIAELQFLTTIHSDFIKYIKFFKLIVLIWHINEYIAAISHF